MTPAPGRRAAARRYVVALLLAVLTLAGGAPAAAGAGFPVRAPATLPATPGMTGATGTPGTPATPGTTGTTASALPVRLVAAAQPTPPARPTSTAPDRAPQPPATADRAPHSPPWAAAEHPRAAHQLPPPGPGGFVPCPAVLPQPLPVPWSDRTAPVSAAQRLRVALPGVRGPPSAGVHRPRDRFPVPHTSNAVPFSPS